MSNKNIIAQIGDPILRKKTHLVDPNKIKSLKIKNIIKKLIKIMKMFNGAGLAANQIYYNYRICVIEIENNQRYKHLPKIPLKILINPKIKILGKNNYFNSYEGCLSVPNLRGMVKRYCKIKVEYYDEEAKFKSEIINNFTAIVYQHEIDHLDGILFTDRVTNNSSLVTYSNYIKFHESKYLKSIDKYFKNKTKSI